jgi:hypothetical protein
MGNTFPLDRASLRAGSGFGAVEIFWQNKKIYYLSNSYGAIAEMSSFWHGKCYRNLTEDVSRDGIYGRREKAKDCL